MTGREEHQMASEAKIKEKLKYMPTLFADYYYSLNAKEYITTERYINTAYNFLLYISQGNIGKCDLSKICQRDINMYLDSKKYITRKGITKASSDSLLATRWSEINKFMKFLVNNNIISENPCEKTERRSVNDDVERNPMSQEELDVIINNVRCGVGNNNARTKQKNWYERDVLIIVMLIALGVRRTELDEINVEDIDFKNRILTITCKRRKKREYMLHESVMKYIYDWLDKREVLLNGKQCDALFISNRRQRMSPLSIYDIAKKYTDGIDKRIVTHDYRRTYGANVYEATKDIYFVKECLGHESITTTQIYIDTQENKTLEASDIMIKSCSI